MKKEPFKGSFFVIIRLISVLKYWISQSKLKNLPI